MNFDDLTGTGIVPDGYGGINWGGVWKYSDNAEQPPYAPYSGQERVFLNNPTSQPSNETGETFTFITPHVFDGAWFSGSASRDTNDDIPNAIFYNLYYQNTLVYSSTVYLHPTSTPTYFASGYSGLVDKVDVGGAPYIIGTDGDVSYVMDDVTYESASSVSLTSLTWNTDQDGTAANAGHRGIDFSYNVVGLIPEALTIPIDFYWATGTTFDTKIQQAVDATTGMTDSFDIDQIPGTHGHGTSDPFQYGNDPARWGMPPAGAKYILAAIDPDDLLNSGQQPSASNGRLLYLQLPSSDAQVLDSSVIPIITQTPTPYIDANFLPGVSNHQQILPLSEAEVYLGVDHFNWFQQFTSSPSSWQYVRFTNLDTSMLTAAFPYLQNTASGIYFINADGTLNTTEKVTYIPLDLPQTDPIVQTASSDPTYNLGIIYKTTNRVYPLIPPQPDNDQYVMYYGEGPSVQSHTLAYDLTYLDAPSDPATAQPFLANQYKSFRTDLVGVGYDKNVITDYSTEGFAGTFFNWNSNTTVTDADQYAGGGLSGSSASPIPPEDYVSGGITLVPNPPPSAVPPIVWLSLDPVPSQNVQVGNTLSVNIIANTQLPGRPTSYHFIGAYPPNASVTNISEGAADAIHIDPASGVFSFTPQVTGNFPITIAVADQAGHSYTVSFNVTVTPVSVPPSVTLGPNGSSVTHLTFTRTGSFQGANSRGPFTATVDYGDGSPVQPLPLNSDGTLNLSHVYSTSGSYVITVRVTDSTGLTGTGHFTVSVTQPSSGLGRIPDAFLAALYQEVLGRAPDYVGIRYWAGELKARLRRPIVARLFFASRERRSLVKQGEAPKITYGRALADAERVAHDARLS